MARTLITTWDEYKTAAEHILLLAHRRICLYDDASQIQLESPKLQAGLRELLKLGQPDSLQIAVRNADSFQQRHPRLLQLLGTYGHLARVQKTPEHLANLRDTILIVDHCHALVRFDRDSPRSKMLLDEAGEVSLYLTRFSDIWREGGEPITSTALGL